MAFDPYLFTTKMECYGDQPHYFQKGKSPQELDLYTDSTSNFHLKSAKTRSEIVRQQVPGKNKINVENYMLRSCGYVDPSKPTNDSNQIHLLNEKYDDYRTQYQTAYNFPVSHNIIEDCRKCDPFERQNVDYDHELYIKKSVDCGFEENDEDADHYLASNAATRYGGCPAALRAMVQSRKAKNSACKKQRRGARGDIKPPRSAKSSQTKRNEIEEQAEFDNKIKEICNVQPVVKPQLPQLDDTTVYNCQYYEKDVPYERLDRPRHKHVPPTFPLESATTHRLEYPLKEPLCQHPMTAQLTKYGTWSMTQMNKEFSTRTEHSDEFTYKGTCPSEEILPVHNLKIPPGKISNVTETSDNFDEKPMETLVIPKWVETGRWVPPESLLESETNYKHYYKPIKIEDTCPSLDVTSPKAAPFCSITGLCYSGHDPKINQYPEFELREVKPWPYVKLQPYIYEDNIRTDRCAPLQDVTIYKSDFKGMPGLMNNKSYRPSLGYIRPIVPMDDRTIQKLSYRTYSEDELIMNKRSCGPEPGRKPRVDWGPFKCAMAEEGCLPRFPAPYGHPLKPFTKNCRFGKFDDRTSNRRDFVFWLPQEVEKRYSVLCEVPDLPKGQTLNRREYIDHKASKSKTMPPPIGKAYRSVTPCSHLYMDTLYNSEYQDLAKTMSCKDVLAFRGFPYIRTRREELNKQVAKPFHDPEKGIEEKYDDGSTFKLYRVTDEDLGPDWQQERLKARGTCGLAKAALYVKPK